MTRATPSRSRPAANAAEPRQRRAADRLGRAVGRLTTAATSRMERDLPWYRELSAEDRSWIGLIAQAGIKSFLTWLAESEEGRGMSAERVASQVSGQVFGAAPRALTGVVTLHQTVELVRTTIEVVEEEIESIVGSEDAPAARAAALVYSREVAFATAEVYARAAETRGAWDARLEALVVDSVLRSETDDTLASRASALGWTDRGRVLVVLGAAPAGAARESTIDDVHRTARDLGYDALCSVHGDRLVVLLGGVRDPDAAGSSVLDHFGEGPVVVGPMVDDLTHGGASAREALAAHRAASGWPDAPRPVQADDLLPERALAGDGHARRRLVTDVYDALAAGGSSLLETIAAYLEGGSSIEGTSRALFVHANTVRYRLRRAAEITGLEPAHPRDAYTLRLALTLGRLARGRAVPPDEAAPAAAVDL